MRNRIPVWYSLVVEQAIIATRSPITTIFRNHVQGGTPFAFRRANDTELQHMIEFPLGRYQFVWRQTSCSRKNGSTGSLNMVQDIIFNQRMTRRRSKYVRKILKKRIKELITRLFMINNRYGTKRKFRE